MAFATTLFAFPDVFKEVTTGEEAENELEFDNPLPVTDQYFVIIPFSNAKGYYDYESYDPATTDGKLTKEEVDALFVNMRAFIVDLLKKKK